METEKGNKVFFLDNEIIQEKGKFTTTVYQKPTFSGIYSSFKSFLPSVYKFGKVHTLVYGCFRICSRKNGCPENFIDKCFEKFLNNINLIKENAPIVVNKQLLLVFPYLGIYLQTRNKRQQAQRVF